MKKTIEEKLRELAESEDRSMTARLADVLPSVEEALAKGVSRGAVLQVLKAEGLEFTPSSFEKALYRLRQRARKGEGLETVEKRPGTSVPPVVVIDTPRDARGSTKSPAPRPRRGGDRQPSEKAKRYIQEKL